MLTVLPVPRNPVRPLLAIALLAALPASKAQMLTLDPLTVSATRGPEAKSEVPFGVEVAPTDAFAEAPTPTVDGVLRSFADFSLFRRADSLTANPTTQGVSLRGLGPSGASRSLVLLDGVPLTDPFGGWVPWSAVQADSLAGAEIVPGGGASAWGNEALAGVIQLFSAPLQRGTGNASAEIADFGSARLDLSEAISAGPGTLELRGEAFSTRGTEIVAPESRGAVDQDAASRHSLATARWRGPLGRSSELTVSLRHFEEWRDNGTAYQQNRLRLSEASAVLSGRAGPDRTWSATAYLQGQDSSQQFSSVNALRTAETPASDQFAVPATAAGAAASTRLKDESGGSTTLGADVRDVRGETREDFQYSKGSYADERFAGGRQSFAGAFAERLQPLGPSVNAMAAVRLDRWEDSEGHQRTSLLSNGAPILDAVYPDRAGTEFSPSAGATWEAAAGLRLHISGQHAFRQPTLNELFRPFRQGNTTTLANANLSAEHADTGEIGATWERGGMTLALTGFAARLSDPVANVTLAQGPGSFPLFGSLPAGSIGQQRLNLGRIGTEGAQLDLKWALCPTLSLDA